MKKSLTYILLLFLAFMSCEGPTGPAGPPGRDGQDGLDGYVNFSIAYYTISTWTVSEDETYFYADVDYPELTEFVYNEGAVVGYYMLDYNLSSEVQIPLPYDIYNNTQTDSWTETISYDFVPGNIRFYYEPSDFFVGFNPPVCTFKIALLW